MVEGGREVGCMVELASYIVEVAAWVGWVSCGVMSLYLSYSLLPGS